MADHGLGRLYKPDSRDEQYPLRALLEAAPPAPLPETRLWTPGPIIDQGQTPRCIGFGCKDWLTADPNHDRRRSPAPSTLYRMAQQRDGDPTKHDGSTVRAGLKALQDLGRVASYHWAQSLDDVVAWLLGHGTLIVGTAWRADMFTPDHHGLVRATGEVVGGHCYLCIGADRTPGLLRFQNSWGTSWSQGGLFSMTFTDFAGLLEDQGEAAAALEHAA